MIGYIVLGVLATVLLLVAVANSPWAAKRDWVCNKHNPRPTGSGTGQGSFGQIFQPSIEHVVEEQSSERIRSEQDKFGEGRQPEMGASTQSNRQANGDRVYLRFYPAHSASCR